MHGRSRGRRVPVPAVTDRRDNEFPHDGRD